MAGELARVSQQEDAGDCEIRVLADLNGWSTQLTFNQENWVCRAEAALATAR